MVIARRIDAISLLRVGINGVERSLAAGLFFDSDLENVTAHDRSIASELFVNINVCDQLVKCAICIALMLLEVMPMTDCQCPQRLDGCRLIGSARDGFMGRDCDADQS